MRQEDLHPLIPLPNLRWWQTDKKELLACWGPSSPDACMTLTQTTRAGPDASALRSAPYFSHKMVQKCNFGTSCALMMQGEGQELAHAKVFRIHTSLVHGRGYQGLKEKQHAAIPLSIIHTYLTS